MNSIFYGSLYNRESTTTKPIELHSLTELLQQDYEQLVKESYEISYYHPNIDRDKAENLLRAKYMKIRHDGLFLLRDCSSSSFDFSLSLIYNNKCYHYKIQLIYDIYFCIDSGPQIAGIENLIHFYQERADGLICNLSHEFIQGQPPPITLRSKGSTNTLHRACQQGDLDIVKRILSSEHSIHQPDINSKDSSGSTALHQASFFGHDNIVRLLIAAGSHILARDASGATALHRAAAGNHPSTMLILIQEGLADYEERNYTNSWVPLHEAAFYNAAACVRVLLDYGASARPRTDQGKTPLQLAEEAKAEESAAILRQYKAPAARSLSCDWLHNQVNVDRYKAQQIIGSATSRLVNGIFLIRRSSKNPKNYALTLYHDNQYLNFEIVRLDETTFHIDDGPYFDSLEHLVDHYCRVSDGLPTILTCSINQLGEIVQSRVKPLISNKNYKNNPPQEAIANLKSNTHSHVHFDETQLHNGTHSSSFNNRSRTFSSLNNSMSSLASSASSRSRTSSVHDNSLSTSSSNASLASPNTSKNVIPLIPQEVPLKNTKVFVDRRNLVGGKVKPFVPELNNGTAYNQCAKITVGRDKSKSSNLNFISPDLIQQVSKLGEGEFGEVYKGFYRCNATTTVSVAIKVLKGYSFSAKQDFLREAEHMSKLNHHCICKLYGIVDSNGSDMMMIIELLLFGSMLDYLCKNKHEIDEHRLKLWASQIADGMEYMEYKGIVHRDLAARNLLLQSIDQVKISDFGLSRCIDTDIYVQKSDSKIPVKWYAPEAINIGKFTSKSDVWSFGITLWEMFSYGETPYGDMTGSDVYYTIKQGRRLEPPQNCPPYIYQIMLRCWEWEENKRPTFYQLVLLLKRENQFRLNDRVTLKATTSVNGSINERQCDTHEITHNHHGTHTTVHF